jgi:chromosome segregation ATPase
LCLIFSQREEFIHKDQTIKNLKSDIKQLKLDNIRLSTDIESLQSKLSLKASILKSTQKELLQLQSSIAYLTSQNQKLQSSVPSLESALEMKDQIIQKLKESLDKTIDKFSTEGYEEYTLGPNQLAPAGVEEVMLRVEELFQRGDDEELNHFLAFVKEL